MTYLIFKRIKSEPVTFKVFNTWRTVPLARWKFLTSISHMYPSADFLREKYGLKDEDIISVRYTKDIGRGRRMWTIRFKHFHNGSLKDFEIKAHDYCSRIRKQRNRKKKYLIERRKLEEQHSTERQAAEKERTMKRIIDKIREENMAAAEDDKYDEY